MKNLKAKIIEILISPAKNLSKLDKIMIKTYPREHCIICGHPLKPSKRINEITDQILEVRLTPAEQEVLEEIKNYPYKILPLYPRELINYWQKKLKGRPSKEIKE